MMCIPRDIAEVVSYDLTIALTAAVRGNEEEAAQAIRDAILKLEMISQKIHRNARLAAW